MNNYIVIALVILSNIVCAQEKISKLNIEFGYGNNCYAMETLNTVYIDSFASKNQLHYDRIEMGNKYGLGIHYKPIGLFNVGLYGSYQYGNSKSNPIFQETNDIGWLIATHQGQFELRTEAIA